MSKNRMRIIKIAGVVLMVAILVNTVMTKPVHLSEDGVGKCFAAVVISTDRLTFDGHASITKKQDIEKAVKILNGIRAFRFGEYSVEDLEGDSPTAWVELSDGEGERLDSVYFYQDILLCESGYYRISMSEYDKLIQLCRDFSDQQ